MDEQHFLTIEEAYKALKEGNRVQFHWRNKTTEINTSTSLDDLRWSLMANFNLLVSDVTKGKYSLIN